MRSTIKLTVLCGLFFVMLSVPNARGQFFFMMENPLVGEKAPNFRLTSVSGRTETLSQARQGKNAIVFFWATWCPSCAEEIQALSKMKDGLEAKGIRVILVDLEESASKVAQYLKKRKIDMDVYLDEDAKVADEYGLIGVPTFYFIDKEGVVQAVEHTMPEDIDAVFLNKESIKTKEPS